MGDDGKSRRRHRQPKQIPDGEARDEGPDALQTAAENARDERGDARPRRRHGDEIYAGENQQGGKRHDETLSKEAPTPGRVTGCGNRRGQVTIIDGSVLI